MVLAAFFTYFRTFLRDNLGTRRLTFLEILIFQP